MSSSPAPTGVLLDTCAAIWLANRNKMRAEALETIFHAALHDGVFVSPVTAWEIGMIARGKQFGSPHFLPDPKTWFESLMSGRSVKLAPLTPAIAIDASCLPEPLHGDPGDRLLIATARHIGFPVITRDRKIEAYAKLGHVGMIKC